MISISNRSLVVGRELGKTHAVGYSLGPRKGRDGGGESRRQPDQGWGGSPPRQTAVVRQHRTPHGLPVARPASCPGPANPGVREWSALKPGSLKAVRACMDPNKCGDQVPETKPEKCSFCHLDEN